MTAPLPDLTVHQITEPDLVNAAVQAIRLRIPSWQPREGNTEVMLIEALAVIAGQTIYAVNQLPGVILGQLLALYGVDRLPAGPAHGQIKVTATSSLAQLSTLPAGTRLRVPGGDGTSIDLLTVADVAINPGSGLDGWVEVEAEQPGAEPNGLPSGTAVELVSPATWVESIVLSQPMSGGVAEESEDAWLGRGAAVLRRQTSALVLAPHFTDAALSVTGVRRAATINLWDGSSGTAGEDTGHVTVVAADAAGQPLGSDTKADAQQTLNAGALAGLTVHVVDPAYRDGTLTWAVTAQAGVDAATVKANIEAAVLSALSPSVWEFGASPNVFTLAGLIGAVAGVTAVTACSWAWDSAAVAPVGRMLIGDVSFADETVTQP